MAVMEGQTEAPFLSLASILWFFSKAYQAGADLNAWLYTKEIRKRRSLPCLVISVGNITVGGTGKTPMTMYMARLMQDMGYKVAVVSRGYKGRAEKKGAVVSDGKRICLSPRDAGDEPYMMAGALAGIPVLVGRNRYEAGRMAVEKFGVDAIILDDGFQHLALKRDVDLVLLDQQRPWGNGHLLPRGTLREAPKALKRADAAILISTEAEPEAIGQQKTERQSKHETLLSQIRCFQATKVLRVDRVVTAANSSLKNAPQADLKLLRGRRVVAFSGLADNKAFLRALSEAGCQLVQAFGFDDHHWYHQSDIDQIIAAAESSQADLLVTTAKDYARNLEKQHWPIPTVILTLDFKFNNLNSFQNCLRTLGMFHVTD